MESKDLVEMLQKRIADLENEGQKVAQQAADNAYMPYRAAINENNRVLQALIEADEQKDS